MPASQQCPECGSPLDPCACETEGEYVAPPGAKTNSTLGVKKPLEYGGRIGPGDVEDAEEERRRTYGPPERRRWIREQPSVVSGERGCVNAHVPPYGDASGTGRKADARWVVPLTIEEERELHRVGRQTFEEEHDVDLAAEAEQVEERWSETDRAPVDLPE